VRKPWESEQAAFSFLLRVIAVCVVVAVISTIVKAVT
jgi:hypothetical protein